MERELRRRIRGGKVLRSPEDKYETIDIDILPCNLVVEHEVRSALEKEGWIHDGTWRHAILGESTIMRFHKGEEE